MPATTAIVTLWITPDHPEMTTLTVHEQYTGLRGQRRICLVDRVGRVWHYDRNEVKWVGYGGRLELADVDPAWERQVHSFISRPRRPRTLHELKASRAPKPLCMHCDRPNFLGRPLLHIGNRQRVCIDCWSYFTGIDPRDPTKERTARSGDPEYLTVDEWRELGEPSAPLEEGIGLELEPAFTVDKWGSTFQFLPPDGWFVDGESYNPDEDGVHQPGR